MNDSELIKKYTNILVTNNIKDTISEVIIKSPDDLIGEHMGSIIEYVTVHYKDKKKGPQELFVKKMLPTTDPFQLKMGPIIMLNEGEFLTAFVSEITDLCEEKLGTGNDVEIGTIFPKTYFADAMEIVMENMASQGYFMLKKSQLQNFEMAKLVMLNLAKLHATSFCVIKQSGGKKFYVEKHPKFYDLFCTPECQDVISAMFNPTFILILEMLKANNSVEALTIFQKLNAYTGKVASTMSDIIKSDSIYDVVNHGDCWNNNMMFSPETKKKPELAKILFVDFQMTRISSPALDIGYYIFTSVKPEVRKRTKELLQIYFDATSNLVLRLGEDFPYTFEEFLLDYGIKSKYGIILGLVTTLAFEAMSVHDTAKAEGNVADQFSDLISNWVANNRERVDEIVQIVISKVNDFEMFGQF